MTVAAYGASSASSASGACESCELVSEQCKRIAGSALCENWQARLLGAQSALRVGQPENRNAAQAEVDRVERIARGSRCGSQAPGEGLRP